MRDGHGGEVRSGKGCDEGGVGVCAGTGTAAGGGGGGMATGGGGDGHGGEEGMAMGVSGKGATRVVSVFVRVLGLRRGGGRGVATGG